MEPLEPLTARGNAREPDTTAIPVSRSGGLVTSSDPELQVVVTSAPPAPPIDDVEASLYEKRQKIYPREVHGWFATMRVTGAVALLGLFYGVCWLRWDERQLLLFDLPARRFNVFWWTFYPRTSSTSRSC